MADYVRFPLDQQSSDDKSEVKPAHPDDDDEDTATSQDELTSAGSDQDEDMNLNYFPLSEENVVESESEVDKPVLVNLAAPVPANQP
jgi:hypothetical protein